MAKPIKLHINISYWTADCSSHIDFGFEVMSKYDDDMKIMDKIKKALKAKSAKTEK